MDDTKPKINIKISSLKEKYEENKTGKIVKNQKATNSSPPKKEEIDTSLENKKQEIKKENNQLNQEKVDSSQQDKKQEIN